MSHTTVPSERRPGLRALDPDLPFLAAEVAIDVANILSGKSDDRSAMQRLSGILSQSIEMDSGARTLQSRMDMAALTILSEAVSATQEEQSLENVQDLLAKANQIAKVLACDGPQCDRQRFEEARNFCVALSRAAAAYSESIRDLRPSHPFRK